MFRYCIEAYIMLYKIFLIIIMYVKFFKDLILTNYWAKFMTRKDLNPILFRVKKTRDLESGVELATGSKARKFSNVRGYTANAFGYAPN